MISNIDEPWDGHSYEVVESFIKGELEKKLEKSGTYENGDITVFNDNGEIVSSGVPANTLLSKSDGPISDWKEQNPYDVAYIKNKPTLAQVATSGSYTDLSERPTLSRVANTGKYEDLQNKPTFAQVAFSGDYNDLSNKPTGMNQVNSDWFSESGVSKILNKPSVDQVMYAKVTVVEDDITCNKDIPEMAEWENGGNRVILVFPYGNESIEMPVVSYSYVRNTSASITFRSNTVTLLGYNIAIKGEVTYSGGSWGTEIWTNTKEHVSYNDLDDKPTEPIGQVNADWDATEGPAEILHKPDLAPVATSGSYNDLDDKPAIPTVPTDVSAFNNDAGYLNSSTLQTALEPITEVIPDAASSTNKLADKNYVNANLSSKASTSSVQSSLNSLEARIDSEKQDKLVNGVSIKTINGDSILGEGNIEIQRGADGVDAVNPFKGWFDNQSSLENEYSNPSVGDYAYVKDTNSVHIWRCSTAGTWADSLTEFNPANNQSFMTGENLNEVGMSDNMKSGSENDVAKANTVTKLFSEIGDDTFVETEVQNATVIDDWYVESIDGTLHDYTGTPGAASYTEYEIHSGEKLRFLGFKVNAYKTSGYAFGYYEEEDGVPTWKTIDSFMWAYDPYMEYIIKYEYIVDIPEGSTHFRTTCKTSGVDISSEIYCYARSGKSVQDKIKEINGYVRVLDSVNARYSNKIEENGWVSVSSGAVSKYTGALNDGSDTAIGISWRVIGSGTVRYSSNYINLKNYLEKGYNRIIIYSSKTKKSAYTFTSSTFLSGTGSVDNTQAYAYFAQISTGPNDRIVYIEPNTYKIIDLPKNTDALYLYLGNIISDDGGNGREHEDQTCGLPISVIMQKIEKNPGTILKNSNRDIVTDISGKPIPPKLHNLKWNGSYMEDSETALTTAGIYGDFVCTVNKEYKINRVMYINQNGEIVNEYVAREDSPTGVIDGWSAAGRQTYGSCWRPLQCGVVIEITKMNPEEPISSKENIFKNFFWIDNNLMKSELLTSPHYNSEMAVDDDTDKNPENMYYTKDSVRAALKRAKIPIMIAWRPLRYIMSTAQATRPFRGTPGMYELGVPYSRSSCKDTWFGFEISPYTYLSAISNPYSIMYTDKIGFNTTEINKVFTKNSYPTTWNSNAAGIPQRKIYSEYNIYYGTQGSQHGIPPYGMVCSAYGSFIYGYLVTNDTSQFVDDPRCYLLEEHGFRYSGSRKEWKLQYPVQAADIPPLTVITTPGHTYAVIDFYLDENGERIAAIVAESTHPYSRVGLYSMERFQARLDAEYDYYVTKESESETMIEVNCIKPSVLDENKNINVWDVNDLYQIDSTPLLGNCETNHNFPKNIMFFMGDKAVIVRRNKKRYDDQPDTKEINWHDNITSAWVIIKPEGLYTHLVLEKWSRGIDGVWETFTYSENIGTTDEPNYVERESVFVIDEVKETFKNQANQNNEYFKANLTKAMVLGPGKYRAYLTYEKPVVDDNGDPVIGENDEPETVTVKSDVTQWIVLAADIYRTEASNGTKYAVWESESNNPDFLDENSPDYSPDEYATPIFATICIKTGAGGGETGYQMQKNALVNKRVKFINENPENRVKVGFACKWGVGTRRAITSSIPTHI